MTHDFGTGVSRVLSPEQASMIQVIWQQGKPPLDAELNFLQQLAEDWRRMGTLRGTPSGWLSNGVNMEEDFVTNASWSNWFRHGLQKTGEQSAITWAVVNGWIVPVTGTGTGSPPGSPNDTDTWNKIALDPPPSNSGDSRIDFAFLEVWLARVPPNPSSTNKPSSSAIYRYGNVEGGYTYISDDLQDPAIGFETTQRVQLQYRLRVVTGLVGLTSYPDGFDPTVVKGRGAASSDTSWTFENMREELGDEGLWRAGDGTSNALGTVDGYTYAIPLCVIFRRNSVAWDGDPGQNLNGAFNRNPTAVDTTGATTFSTTATLDADITDSDLTLDLVSVSNIALPLTPSTTVTIQVDDEIMTYSVITGTTMTLSSRGALGTRAEAHLAGATVTVLAGRPDGLFSDQIAKTDILDLRHAVNPNGFDHDTLLRASLDKLLRGQLRSTWKRSGGGPQGPFVFYQDKISASAAALGVTLLDAPDGHRTVFSDAAMQQAMEFVAQVPVGKSTSEDITETWGLSLSGEVNNNGGNASEYNPGDIITIPVAQLTTSLPGSDTDQLRFISDAGAVSIRIDGEQFSLTEGTHFSVTAITDPADDLVITLEPDFPANTQNSLYITFHVQWGPGRGISRRPDALHSVSYLSASSDIMIQQAGVPADNTPMRTAWALLWSKYRDDVYHNLLPVTAESYADIGSKTVILTPFRRIAMPDTMRVLDGSYVNINWDEEVTSGTAATTTSGNATFTDGSKNFTTLGVVEGDALVITSPASVAGTYYASGTIGTTTFDIALAAGFPATASNIVYSIYHTQGLMPTDDISGTTKWTTTDPLGLFSGSIGGAAATKNLYIPLPRKLVPGWGEVRVPILHEDAASFDEGVNFLFLSTKGNKSTGPDSENNYVPWNGNTPSWAPFSTLDLNTDTPATYNATFSYGTVHCGIRFFTDSRNMGRQGLELPPFYGIARLFAVYEAQDYKDNGTDYNPTTREFISGAPDNATNLLRQNFDGPTFWIEIDDDGDSTFIVNAEAIDITRSPNTIADFESGDYVVEATIFGFDRNAFELGNECRIVLARVRGSGQADDSTRTNNYGQSGTKSAIAAPDLVIPAPPVASDEIAINYSRTPYQGDAWGSQTSQQDISHEQGPLLTSTVYQLISTELNGDSLTRPNQKTLEVVSSVGFMTTMGTGRLSGDLHPTVFDFRNIGYEDHSAFPPASGSDPRPDVLITATANDEAGSIGSVYHGCTERLPLGALFRDKDFRGGFVQGDFTGRVQSPLVYTQTVSPGVSSASIAANQSYEQDVVNVSTSTLSSGQPGELVVHVDGEQGNYGLLTNFRTLRGGSAFSATPPWPGGELEARFPQGGSSISYAGVLCGTAYLVRNAVTSIGSTEVSAGSELMMLISTTALHLAGAPRDLFMFLGTNGTGEGYSASDLYRIAGHPLIRDNVRVDIDPSSLDLARKTTDTSFEA